MIVDDESIIRTILSKQIEIYCSNKETKYKVVAAVNGAEAVELFVKLKPELTFMDVEMPEMDGVSAFYRMKELNSGVAPKTVFVTGYADHEDVQERMDRAVADGAIGFYKKPLRQPDLRSIMDSQLAASQQPIAH
jgi:two-component system chemotaxis response regulator CheY